MQVQNGLNSFPALEKQQEFTKQKLEKIRSDLQFQLGEYSERLTIVATGSYGRLEASEESDLDLFVIYDDDFSIDSLGISEKLKETMGKHINKPPGDTGTFGPDAHVSIGELTSNIGGNNDSNTNFTRRILFLLEGTYLLNKKKFDEYKDTLLKKYIKDDIPNHQVNRFFLNDIIRYYRTIATDFEYKVSINGKSWGLRNIKLRFSRKLLYFSGIIVAAETCYQTYAEKLRITKELLELCPIDRLIKLSSTWPIEILRTYNIFSEEICKKEIRNSLERVEKEDRDKNEDFARLKNLGQHFSWALSLWLRNKYDVNHPIHHALLF